MAHFALVNDENVVERVIVVKNDDCAGGDFPHAEAAGQQYLASIGISGRWLQTSYNANFRGKYAGIGDLYQEETDSFVSND